MSTESIIQDTLMNHKIEDRPIILMRLQEKLLNKKYSNRDYKNAEKIRKRLRRKRIIEQDK